MKKYLFFVFVSLFSFILSAQSNFDADKKEAGGDFPPFSFFEKVDYTKRNPTLGYSYRFGNDYVKIDEYHYSGTFDKNTSAKTILDKEFDKVLAELKMAVDYGIYKAATPAWNLSRKKIANKLDFISQGFKITDKRDNALDSLIFLAFNKNEFLKYRITFYVPLDDVKRKEIDNFIENRVKYLSK